MSASAQKKDQFDFIVADIRVMENRKVQNDMGVTQAQRDRMNAFAKQHEQRLSTYQQSLKDLKPTLENKKKVQLQLVKHLERLKTEVIGVLNPAQLKRLREITLQRYGWTAVSDERVGKRIGMTSAQTQKVRSILSAASKKAGSIEKAAAEPVLAPYRNRKPKDQAEAQQWQAEAQASLKQVGERIRPQLVAIQTKASQDIQAVLTPKQRSSLIALQGRKYVPK